MRAWLLVAMAACGRSGFTESTVDADAPADVSPDPIDWTDFTNVSTLQTITGTNRDIDVHLQASVGSGTPTLEYRVDVGTWIELSTAMLATVTLAPASNLQFRIGGAVGDTGFFTVTNASTSDSLLDTVRGTVGTPVSGNGTPASPFVAPGAPPASCHEFLASYPEQTALDGSYSITAAPLVVYCDMTSDKGGWTLVARVRATSTTHVTAAAVGTVSSPTQTTTGKLADATITALDYANARFVIDTLGTVYVTATSLDLSGAAFNLVASAAPALAGPYTFNFATTTSCSSDCGVGVVTANLPFGRMCGYRYYASSGNPRNGMGCQGAFGKNGTVWVR